MKKKLISFVVAGLLVGLPFAYGNDAPIEDLSVQPSQTDNEITANNGPAGNAQYSDQQQEAPVDSQSTTADSSDSLNMTNENASDAATTGSDQDRIARLEQQVSNITNMNLPQQIEELRQEVQQLNGRIQVEQHDIKVLESQQRSFYQDLNRRIQQIKNGGNETSVQTPQNKTNMKPMPVNAALNDSSAYRSAFNLLIKKKYDDAMRAFQTYLRQYPNGNFVANAYYWMGELYLKKNDVPMAAQSFKRIITQYPSSNKVPDAKLKLAIIHVSQGKADQARQEFKAIKRCYPNSTAAQLASIQLQRMAQ